GEDAALACDRVQLQAVIAHVTELVGGDAQLGVDLVYDSAGAARALVVHRGNLLLLASLRVLFEDDDLRVLAAEFDDRACFRVELLDRQRNGVHLLHELRADESRDAAAARTGDEDAERGIRNREFLLDAFEELQDLLRLLGLVALVILPE